MSTPRTYTTSMRSVFDGRRCIGFVLPRGRSGWEAFDANDVSLGRFPTAKEAADCLWPRGALVMSVVLTAERSSGAETAQGRRETERGHRETGRGHSETAGRSS
jgi:hypothetical protein